jgi:hypothetical protein
MVLGAPLARGIAPETFFRLKGLSAAEVSKLNTSIKSSRETLALADQLQTMRDNAKTLHELEMSVKDSLKSARRRSSIMDIFS